MTVSTVLPNVTAAKIRSRGAWRRMRLGVGPRRWLYVVIGVAARKGDWLHGVRCIFGDRTHEAAKRFAETAAQKLHAHWTAHLAKQGNATLAMSQPVHPGISGPQGATAGR